LRIGVIGAGSCGKEIEAAAESIGRWIGEKGHVLVCGGLGGVMEAAARGAKSGGGVTLGILPGCDAREANPYIDYPIVTGMSHARNAVIAWTSDLLVAVSGEYGTLSEMALGLKMGRSVIAYRSRWKGMEGVVDVETLEEALEAMEKFSD